MKNNNTILAYCGLVCETCPIHLASLEKDISKQQEMRESIARTIAEQYGMNLKPEDINDCDGCRADTGRIFSGCLNCEIRKCAITRNIENCAYCQEYPCDKLNEIFRLESEAQTRLDAIRKSHKITE